MTNPEFLTGTYPVSPGQLAHDLAIAKLIKCADVPGSASDYLYYGTYIKFLREFEVVVESRRVSEEEEDAGL